MHFKVQKKSGVNVCSPTRFLCGEISNLIRAHLLRVFSLLENTNGQIKIGCI